jgi:hypothetical protein
MYSHCDALEAASVAYAEAIHAATTPAHHLLAAQAIGDNAAIHPTDQGLVVAAGLSIYVQSLGAPRGNSS